MSKGKIHLVDTTLRDGSHAVSHQYTVEQVAAVAGGLDAAGIEYIEVTHGDGLAGSSLNYGRSATDEEELIKAAAGVIKNGILTVLLIPGIGTIEDLKRAEACGVYSSFLLHTYRAAERFNLDPRDILVELGRRRMVGGQ